MLLSLRIPGALSLTQMMAKSSSFDSGSQFNFYNFAVQRQATNFGSK
jgi:hypothetical protein